MQVNNYPIQVLFALVLALAMSSRWAHAEEDGYIYKGDKYIGEIDKDDMGDLARAAQNPVADLISVPFQNNTNFNFGPREKTQNVLNIQPVVPFDLNEDWLMITRAIIPIVSQPSFRSGQDRESGLGDSTVTTFLSPKDKNMWLGNWLWGAGPVFLLPTNTDDRLGPGEWGVGVSALALSMPGRWVIGSLVSNVWGLSDDKDVNLFTWQYFVNYNLDAGWYLTSSPSITANWDADSDDTWTVPFGAGFGRVFPVGGLPINASLQSFYNVEEPDNVGPEWSIRFNLQFMFPR
jgi:hypothetical protein